MRSIAGTLFLTDFRSRCQLLIPRPIFDARKAANATGFTSSGGLISVTLRRLAIMETPTAIRDLLFTLLLKVGLASSIAALLAPWDAFRRVLFTEERDPDQKLKLMLFMTPALIVGVTLRLVGGPSYAFADLSLEGAFLMGLLGGRVVGPIGGAIITIPALISHEWLAMPAASTAGVVGGVVPAGDSQKKKLLEIGAITVLDISETAGEV